MTGQTPSPTSRKRTAYLFCGLFALGGVGLLCLAAPGLVSPISLARAHAPVIGFSPHDAIAIGPAISLFAFAAMTTLPEGQGAGKTARKSGARAQRRADPAAILLAVAFVGIGLSFIASPVAEVAVGAIVEGQGYARCPPAKVWDRYVPIHWALSSARCP